MFSQVLHIENDLYTGPHSDLDSLFSPHKNIVQLYSLFSPKTGNRKNRVKSCLAMI